MPKIPDSIKKAKQPKPTDACGAIAVMQLADRIGKATDKDALAINLLDLDRIPQPMRGILLDKKVDISKAIFVDKNRFDEVAVAFSCELLQAAGTCDVIRLRDKKNGDYPTRVYLRRNKAWTKLAGDKMLCVVSNGKVVLNPEIFPEAGYVAPRKVSTVMLGEE